jgi:hypothetical protein
MNKRIFPLTMDVCVGEDVRCAWCFSRREPGGLLYRVGSFAAESSLKDKLRERTLGAATTNDPINNGNLYLNPYDHFLI